MLRPDQRLPISMLIVAVRESGQDSLRKAFPMGTKATKRPFSVDPVFQSNLL